MIEDDLVEIQLTRTLRLTQRRRGHRTGTDDVICAWAGLHAKASQPRRILDLGAGHGSVALMLAGALPSAQITAVEVQPTSFELLRRNIDDNGLGDRIRPILGDLREVGLPTGMGGFDLVTGSPPFMPVGTGVMPADAQRAAARFEIHGGVEEYCEAAARSLAPDGVLSLLMDAARTRRYRAAFPAAGLELQRVIFILPTAGAPPTYGVYQGGQGGDPAAAMEERLIIRGPGGGWSEEFEAARRSLDLPP